MKCFKVLNLLILSTLLLSCSKTTFVVKDKNLKPFKEFSKVTSLKDQTKKIQISKIIDNREMKESLGVAFTGVQYRETPIKLSSQLEEYLKFYFDNGLKTRGVRISKNQADYLMTIRVNELWLEEISFKAPEVVKCKANFTFELHNNKRSWKGNFWSDVVSPGDLSDGTSKIAPTFASCLNLITENLVNSQKFIEFIKL